MSLLLPEPTYPDDRSVRVTPCHGLSGGCIAWLSVSWEHGHLGFQGQMSSLGACLMFGHGGYIDIW